MTVSIITPSCNTSAYIRETIESIQAQTFTDWELLVTDDASTDVTCQIVREYAEHDNRIKLFCFKKRAGVAAARNNSIRSATGRLIAFCDSDDVWLPDKLEKQVRFMLDNRYAFTYAPYHVMNEEGKPLGLINTRGRVNYNDILITCDIGCLTAMYDSLRLGKMYMPLLRRRQDYAMWLHLLKVVDFAYSYPEPLARYRLRAHSISSNKMKAVFYIWKVYRQVEKINFFRSIYLILVYSYYGIRKYSKLRP